MRRFSSYGPVSKKLHYYAPRKELVERAYIQLMGENPEEGGHYITVWAPRQAGKSWAMREILWRLQKTNDDFDVVMLPVETMKSEKDVGEVLSYISEKITAELCDEVVEARSRKEFERIFSKECLKKPLILILDEFDALEEEAIGTIVGAFRNIYNYRRNQDKPTGEKDYLLHGAALIGVRSVIGVENAKGSPFNVQKSLHIPNLTFGEVESMFRWYEKESGQKVENEVIESLFRETRGQPGLTSWFGELLTEGWDQFVPPKDKPISMRDFEEAREAATYVLPNNNILNIISKAKQEPYKQLVLDTFKTDEKTFFKYDAPNINFLYMNGVIESEKEEDGKSYLRFSSPFVQKRLFNYFSHEMFNQLGRLVSDPFRPLDDVITSETINVRNLMKLYAEYLTKNRDWSLKNAPRRSDLRIYEAVFHFSLYSWLDSFLRRRKANVLPEFPTGNGKIDLIIKHAGRTWGLELKSYSTYSAYQEALEQAARYGKQLELEEISLIFFVERIDDENRARLEADFTDPETGVKVEPIFVETGS